MNSGVDSALLPDVPDDFLAEMSELSRNADLASEETHDAVVHQGRVS